MLGPTLKAYLLVRYAVMAPYKMAAGVIYSIFVLQAVLFPVGVILVASLFACRTKDLLLGYDLCLTPPLITSNPTRSWGFFDEKFLLLNRI